MTTRQQHTTIAAILAAAALTLATPATTNAAELRTPTPCTAVGLSWHCGNFPTADTCTRNLNRAPGHTHLRCERRNNGWLLTEALT